MQNLHFCRLTFQPWNDTLHGITARLPDATRKKVPLVPSATCQKRGKPQRLVLKGALLRSLSLQQAYSPPKPPPDFKSCFKLILNLFFLVLSQCLHSLCHCITQITSPLSFQPHLSYDPMGATERKPAAAWHCGYSMWFMIIYVCSCHCVSMEVHSLVHRKCRSLLLHKSDLVRDDMAGFRELKYCLFFISALIFVLHHCGFIASLNKDFMQQWIPGDLEIQPLQSNIDYRIIQIPVIL